MHLTNTGVKLTFQFLQAFRVSRHLSIPVSNHLAFLPRFNPICFQAPISNLHTNPYSSLANSNPFTLNQPTNITIKTLNQITKRNYDYVIPHFVFKGWEKKQGYRSDKYYRSTRARKRRHKKWLKKTRVFRLHRKIVNANKRKKKAVRLAEKEAELNERLRLKKLRIAAHAELVVRDKLAKEERDKEKFARHQVVLARKRAYRAHKLVLSAEE